MAGESAAASARRQRERAARLTASAHKWEQGADGERATAAVLERLPSGWHVRHDVPWPGRTYANVDHVVVGPGGLFVIDSKKWTGEVVVRNGVLRQNGYSRDQVVDSAAASGKAISGLLGVTDERVVHPVLCFVRDEAIRETCRGVKLCSTGTLLDMIMSRPIVLEADQVARMRTDLQIPRFTHPVPRGMAMPENSHARTGRTRRAAVSRRSTTKRRARATGPDVARLLAALVLLAVLATKPELVTGVANLIAGWLTSVAAK